MSAYGGDSRITGVMAAIVVDNKDPDKRGRIKIKFPAKSDDEIGHWARIAVLMAGADTGSYFLPENGDEVLVAFEDGNIAQPYIIGALWNNRAKPPVSNDDGKNNVKVIKTRSGHILRLDDTEGAEKIEIIDKSAKNSITVDTATNTVTITAEKDIILQAAQGSIKLNARNIEIASAAKAKIAAKGGLELNGCPGNTVIKGSVINLN